MRQLEDLVLVAAADLAADIMILLLSAAGLIDLAYEKLENVLLAMIER